MFNCYHRAPVMSVQFNIDGARTFQLIQMRMFISMFTIWPPSLMQFWWVVTTATQRSNTDQQVSFRNRWSSSTSSRIASGSCHAATGTRGHARSPDAAAGPRPSRLEQVKDVLRARCRPKSEEMVIRISEGPAAADRHEARIPDLQEDHTQHPFCLHPPNVLHGAPEHAVNDHASAVVLGQRLGLEWVVADDDESGYVAAGACDDGLADVTV